MLHRRIRPGILGGMTFHRTISRSAAARPQPLIGEIAVASAPSSGVSRRGRMAVIAGLSAWLWVSIATIVYLALR